MKVKPNYSGSDGNYSTNVDRDSGKFVRASQRVESFEPDVPEGPGIVPVQIGIDVGQIGDSTAVAVAEWTTRDDGQHFNIQKLERLELGLPYPKQAIRIVEMLTNLRTLSAKRIVDGEPGFDILTAIDVTGVGRGLYDLLSEAGETVIPATITSIERLSQRDDGEWSCGKSILVSNLLIGIQRGAIHLPQGTEAEALLSELQSFRLEQTPSGRMTFNAKSGAHDDLITALGLSTLPGLRPIEPPGFYGMAVVKGGW